MWWRLASFLFQGESSTGSNVREWLDRPDLRRGVTTPHAHSFFKCVPAVLRLERSVAERRGERLRVIALFLMVALPDAA
jgi:hypothetical protein